MLAGWKHICSWLSVWKYIYIYIYIKSYTHILIGPYPWSIGGQMHGWHNQLKQHFASLSYQTNRFCVAMHLFSSRSQKISWCDKISETLSFASCATFSFLAHFVDIWDLHVLLKRIAKGRGLLILFHVGSQVYCKQDFMCQKFKDKTSNLTLPHLFENYHITYLFLALSGAAQELFAALYVNWSITNKIRKLTMLNSDLNSF